MKKQTKSTEKTAHTTKYKELNDSELEIICGGQLLPDVERDDAFNNTEAGIKVA